MLARWQLMTDNRSVQGCRRQEATGLGPRGLVEDVSAPLWPFSGEYDCVKHGLYLTLIDVSIIPFLPQKKERLLRKRMPSLFRRVSRMPFLVGQKRAHGFCLQSARARVSRETYCLFRSLGAPHSLRHASLFFSYVLSNHPRCLPMFHSGRTRTTGSNSCGRRTTALSARWSRPCKIKACPWSRWVFLLGQPGYFMMLC